MGPLYKRDGFKCNVSILFMLGGKHSRLISAFKITLRVYCARCHATRRGGGLKGVFLMLEKSCLNGILLQRKTSPYVAVDAS